MRAISQIPVSFVIQSNDADEGAQATSILTQPTNELIVPSTKRIAQGGGYVVGIAGFSDTPVAIKFQGAKAETGVIFMRPGMKIRIDGGFDAFEYGLPFGWLGGGHAVIYVGHTKDADLDLGPTRRELVFQSVTIAIEASANPLPALKRNWPLTFPWTRAQRAIVGGVVDQSGNPIIRVHGTRTIARLANIDVGFPVPKTIGLVFRNTREFDHPSEGQDGTLVYTAPANTVGTEITFPASTDPVLRPKAMTTIPEEFLNLDCSEGGLTVVDLGDAELTDLPVNFVRYGRI